MDIDGFLAAQSAADNALAKVTLPSAAWGALTIQMEQLRRVSSTMEALKFPEIAAYTSNLRDLANMLLPTATLTASLDALRWHQEVQEMLYPPPPRPRGTAPAPRVDQRIVERDARIRALEQRVAELEAEKRERAFADAFDGDLLPPIDPDWLSPN